MTNIVQLKTGIMQKIENLEINYNKEVDLNSIVADLLKTDPEIKAALKNKILSLIDDFKDYQFSSRMEETVKQILNEPAPYARLYAKIEGMFDSESLERVLNNSVGDIIAYEILQRLKESK